MSTLLEVSGLKVAVEGREIIRGVDLIIREGETHAIMGPNGSGKSTFVNVLMGHPKNKIVSGRITFRGRDLLAMDVHERAQAGLFLAFQYPKEIAGVSLRSFLFAAYNSQAAERKGFSKISPVQFKKHLGEAMKLLKMDFGLSERSVNKGFSGGEKKRAEILQLAILKPHLALLDETDSGLDVDALKIVAEGVNALRNETFSILLITHYARILEYITPDFVHVMVGGKIVESGGAALSMALERGGYEKYVEMLAGQNELV